MITMVCFYIVFNSWNINIWTKNIEKKGQNSKSKPPLRITEHWHNLPQEFVQLSLAVFKTLLYTVLVRLSLIRRLNQKSSEVLFHLKYLRTIYAKLGTVTEILSVAQEGKPLYCFWIFFNKYLKYFLHCKISCVKENGIKQWTFIFNIFIFSSK